MVNKNRNTFLNNCYEWLFSEEERKPMSFILLFFIIIIISTAVSLFVMSVGRAMIWI